MQLGFTLNNCPTIVRNGRQSRISGRIGASLPYLKTCAAPFASLVLVMLMTCTVAETQEPFARLGESDVRGLSKLALVDAQGNSEGITIAFKHRFAQAFGQELDEVQLLTISGSPVTIGLIGPTGQYLSAFSEAVRKMEPHEALPWEPAVMISVSPRRIDAPDIIRVVLQRNGKVIEPTLSLLVPMEMKTRLGATRLIHGGPVYFPLAAFDPGATVVLTAIPESGANIIKYFTIAELQRIQ